MYINFCDARNGADSGNPLEKEWGGSFKRGKKEGRRNDQWFRSTFLNNVFRHSFFRQNHGVFRQ